MKTLLHFFLSLITLWVSIIIPAVHSQCIKDQQLSLLQFKKSLVFAADFGPSTKIVSWNASTDCCSWVGVTCSRNGRVLGLDISSQGISAGIDNASSLFHLHYLQSLNLADNQLGNYSQSIPSAIGDLLNLRYLNLSLNYYSGQIPIEISRLRRLVVLDFSYSYGELNLGSPNLPMLVHNFTELRELYLDGVLISEQGSEWGRAISSSIPNLRVLSMFNCHLSGRILESLAKLQYLSVIRLAYNNISAPVPGFFANFSNLTVLGLKNCGLHGTFPKEIFQLPSLQSIDLSINDQLDGSLPEFPRNGSLQYLNLWSTNFSGLLPNSIGNLKMLSIIDIRVCKFTGPIPKSMTNLTQLIYLFMSYNNLEGSIPSFSWAKNVVSIDLSHNGLTGTISSTHWRNLTKLSYLSLGSNKLNGNIQASLFSIPLLSSLDLSSNQFSGPFPEISNVSSHLLNGPYLDLYLSSNNLQGPLPMSIFCLLRLTTLDLSSNNLSGSFPLDRLHQLRNLSKLDLSHNNLFLTHDYTNFSYSSSSQLGDLRLVSLKLRTFPNFLRNQSYLYSLDLSDNQINGKIPNWIWSLSDLSYLNLSCNSLDSLEVPSMNPSTLEYLDLHSNQFHGQIPIFPTPFSAYYLDFSRNYFSSIISSTIGDMFLNIGFLSLSSNNLNGIIPESLCNSESLEVLDLSNNSLSGTIPQCVATMKTLAILNVRRNNLTYVNEFSQNCSLKTLDISGNQIQGQFLKSLVNCTQLEVLNLGNNLITEPFPCFLRNTSTLRVLVLRSNKFYGDIGCRDTKGTWPVLQFIDLAHNNFSGEVPGTALTTWQAMRTGKENAPWKISDLHFKLKRGIYQEDTISVTNKGLEMELVSVLTIFTSIDFSCNKFNGSIPEEIGELKSLYALNLSNNAFTGAVPSSLSNLSQLKSLDLSRNKLSGQIPIFPSPFSVYYLDFSGNYFSSIIPSTIGDVFRNTSFFSLSSNNLNGIIPESLCNSQFLDVLDLSNNSLSGTVPQCLTAIGSLAVLNVRRNNLTNVDDFSQNCLLKNLDISENHLQGRFLKSLVNCTQLEVLNLGNNLITEPFPCFLRNLATLRVLILRSNKFYGHIGCRKTDGTWPVLQIIDLAHNKFSGEVPGIALTTWQAMMTSKDDASWKIGNLQFEWDGAYYQEDTIVVTNKGLPMELYFVLNIFTSIDFSCNQFNGSIPEEIGELTSLYALNLSNNAFTGAVPSSLSNLAQLESLDLSKNKLSSQIPPELTKLTFLAFLNLSFNQLVGRIPSGAQFSTFEATSFEGNKGLWGSPLTADNNTGFSPPKPAGNHSNLGHKIDWDIICPEIGFTCGFGIAIGSLLFCKRWRKWYYRAMYNMLLKIFPQLEQRFGLHRRHVYVHQGYWRR